VEDVEPADIAESELVKALMEALHAPAAAADGYYTTKELMEMTGCTIRAVRRGLRKLGEIGSLEGAHVMRYSVLLDRPAASWGYRLKAQTQDENNEEAKANE